ncbi:hypothetical protein JH06_2187 [Blastocystis sp. subtype 4]|uniref:hypothetical protein n=1 Tax=Blastocystis sp. subtype 4 TaxID=944170 RepID=UPI0007120787|nr:hypothetical protein JH06_2187 [Blastocystis sp. subtype 4]KNB46138.1 hypothetical protein JH06_2187 [Blastocystis sp. subtype 4]|eukprot:XP_014529596.1 hypothetical protein JH06_2187 [Blastocystis sp. subtype 4]
MMKRLMENDLLENFQERWNNTGKDGEIYKDEISDFLLGEMDQTFNCSLEDGSDEEIAEILLHFYNSCRNGDMSVVMNFIDKNQNFIPSVNSYLEATKDYKRYEDENCDGDDEYNPDDYEEIDMEEEEPKKKNQPDEDGWVIV